MRTLSPRPDLVAEAHAALREAIEDGLLEPGESLTQEQLAQRLGVSRQPVSQALALLRREGLVVERGRRGLMVAPLEPEAIRELYEVRAALDALAARLAASRGEAGPDALEAEILRGEQAVASGSLAAIARADAAFHRALYALSGNSALEQTAHAQWPHFQRAMCAVLKAGYPGERALAEHRDIADAIRRGDAARAEALVRTHTERGGAEAVAQLSALADVH